jgi:glycine/D-amino acid oxidase-like deaminating enzyme
MLPNNSPWIKELKSVRKNDVLNLDIKTEVAIVGGGIAGICSAYFTLKYTDKKVVLIEGSKVAHGATGHNGGQIVSYFEKPFSAIVDEFGLELAAQGQKDIYDAWDLLHEIFTDASLKTPLSIFQGYAGCSNIDQLNQHLKNKYLKIKGGLKEEKALVIDDKSILRQIPDIYKSLYEISPHSKILSLLETHNKEYIAVLKSKKGCMNSALFCEELVGYLLLKYPTRFKLFEHTKISSIILQKDWGMLLTKTNMITANHIVLCTNGFEHISIFNTNGGDINTKFHELVEGVVGYMSGYFEKDDRGPTAISYLEKTESFGSEDYFYLTRRKYEFEEKHIHNLICLGGPVVGLDAKSEYLKDEEYPINIQVKIDNFLKDNYRHVEDSQIDYKFNWHGLMGFTSTGLRCIGPDSSNPRLIYNLGCNGVGILPSIYGGRKVSRHLNSEFIEKSIFDPIK